MIKEEPRQGVPPAKPETERELAWHRGLHVWEEHDGYPRHQHSINGALTIAPNDKTPHFQHGPPFENKKAHAMTTPPNAKRAAAGLTEAPPTQPAGNKLLETQRRIEDKLDWLHEYLTLQISKPFAAMRPWPAEKVDLGTSRHAPGQQDSSGAVHCQRCGLRIYQNVGGIVRERHPDEWGHEVPLGESYAFVFSCPGSGTCPECEQPFPVHRGTCSRSLMRGGAL